MDLKQLISKMTELDQSTTTSSRGGLEDYYLKNPRKEVLESSLHSEFGDFISDLKAKLQKAENEKRAQADRYYAQQQTSRMPEKPVDIDKLKLKLQNLKNEFDPAYEYSDDPAVYAKQKRIKAEIMSLRDKIRQAIENKDQVKEQGVAEGKFVKTDGGVPSDRHGNPLPPKPPKSVSTMTLKQLEKNKRENPGQSPFKTQDEKVKKYLGLEEEGMNEGPHGGDNYTLGNPVDKEYVYQVWRTANDVRDYKNIGVWVHDGGTTHSLEDAKRRKDALLRGTQGVKAKIVRVPRSQFKLAGPKGHLPGESGAESISIKSTDDNYNIVNSKGEVIKQFHKTPKGLEYAKQFLKQNKGNTGLDENTVAEGYREFDELRDRIERILIKAYDRYGTRDEVINAAKPAAMKAAQELGAEKYFKEVWMNALASHDVDTDFGDNDAGFDYTDYSMRQGERGNPDRFREQSVAEGCGDMEFGASEPPKQMDNVNMNVSLNASGSGGIKDLLDIIRNIDSKEKDMIGVDDMPQAISKMGMTLDDDFANEPDETYAGIDAMTQTGGDLHSKGDEAPNQAGGGNPWNIKPRLESLYNEIKLREGSKHASRPGTEKRPGSAEQAKKAVDRKKEVKADYEKRKAESGKNP